MQAHDQPDATILDETGTDLPEHDANAFDDPDDETADALAYWAEQIAQAPKQARAQMLSGAAAALGAMARDGSADVNRVLDGLRQIARDCGLEAAIGANAVTTIVASAVAAGFDGSLNPVQVRRLADVAPQRIAWLWRGRLALGKLALVAGHPGVGKSQFAAYLAAAVSAGANLPAGGGHAPQGTVLVLSAEDDIADTIRPRLEAAGADLTRVHAFEPVAPIDGGRRRIDLSDDITMLDAYARRVGDVRLVIIDPLTAYVGRLDAHRQSVVRAMLQPVADFAARHTAAVVGITHLNKAGGDALVRVAGSVAFLAAARAAFLIVPEAEGERRLMVPLKNNLGDDRSALAFRITRRPVSGGIDAPALEWDDGPVEISPEEALKAVAKGPQHDGALAEAKAFLSEVLANGALAASAVKSQTAQAGISASTLQRARQELGIRPVRIGGIGADGSWEWALPRA